MRFFPHLQNSCSVCGEFLPDGVFAENEDFVSAGKCFCGENGCKKAPAKVVEKTPADIDLEKQIEAAAEDFVAEKIPAKAKPAKKK